MQTAVADVFGVGRGAYSRTCGLKDLTSRLTGNDIQTDTYNNNNGGTRDGGGRRPGFFNAPANNRLDGLRGAAVLLRIGG
ncbi:hypothetical protein PG994_006471 [Apiospora phragmitis]|uniref:Uncharacterized protein n=1 Tax=Apiospora phragmitis TaxID=2905665 RepID=A0ABR1VF71_9PEZI